MIRFQLDAPAATKPCRSGVSDRAARDRNAIYFSDLGCLGAQCLTAAIVQRRREPTCPSQTPEPPSDDPSGIQRATTLPVSGPDSSAPQPPVPGHVRISMECEASGQPHAHSGPAFSQPHTTATPRFVTLPARASLVFCQLLTRFFRRRHPAKRSV